MQISCSSDLDARLIRDEEVRGRTPENPFIIGLEQLWVTDFPETTGLCVLPVHTIILSLEKLCLHRLLHSAFRFLLTNASSLLLGILFYSYVWCREAGREGMRGGETQANRSQENQNQAHYSPTDTGVAPEK